MNIRDILFLLLCLITYRGRCDVHAQDADSEQVRSYLHSISQLVYSSLASYGLGNLPDVNSKVTYNVSNIAGYRLVGDLFLEDGFVSDIKYINCSSNGQTMIWENALTILADMQFNSLKVARDFRFVPFEPVGVNDTTVGSVMIQPHYYVFNIKLAKHITTQKLTAEVRSYGFSPGWEMITFDPKNGLTQRLRKMYRSQFSHGGQTEVFEGLFQLWQPIFEKFLKDAVQKVNFPDLEFRVGRKLHLLV